MKTLWPDIGGGGLWPLYRTWIRLRDYVHAVRDYPRGMLCGWCHRPNFFYDDIGFFCITPDWTAPGRVCCEHCYRGPLGEAHIARFGIGER